MYGVRRKGSLRWSQIWLRKVRKCPLAITDIVMLMQNWKSYFSAYQIVETDETLRIVFRWPMRVSRLLAPILFFVFSLVACAMFFCAGLRQLPMSGWIWLIPMLPFTFIILRFNRVLQDTDLQFDKLQNALFENGIAKLELKDIVRMEWNLFELNTDGGNVYTLGLKMNDHQLFILAKVAGIEVNSTYRLGIRIAQFLHIPYIDNRMYIKEPIIWAGK